MSQSHKVVSHVIDALAAVGPFATQFLIPPLTAVSAIMAIIWYSIRFYEYFKTKKIMKE